MKCLRCGKEFKENYTKKFCDNCGGFLKCPNWFKWFGATILFIILSAFLAEKSISVVFGLLVIISFICLIITAIIETVQQMKYYKNNDELIKIDAPQKTVFNSFFISSDKYRKKDDSLERGECEIEFKKDVFVIKQSENKIENEITSIYYFDIWNFKDDTYFKFKMRDLNELKFRSEYFEIDEIIKILKEKNIKIEDNRK